MTKVYSERLKSFGTASIPKLVLQFSVPSIAGITLCFPITLFIMAMSMMIGVGGNTLFAIRLG